MERMLEGYGRNFSKTVRMGMCLALALISLHCEHVGPLEAEPKAESEEEESAPTLTEIQNKIFSTSCALSGCHIGSNALMGLDLSSGVAYDNLVGITSAEVSDLMLVKAGDPDNSYLIIKIEGSSRLAAGTFRMPLGREPLSEDDIKMVRDWILDGAPDN